MNEIKIQLGDWLYNAGIVGFVNILLHAKDEVKLNGQEVIFKEEVLEGFEEKYFKYFIDTYKNIMIYSKLINILDNLLSLDLSHKLSDEKIESINKNIDYVKSKLQNSAYKGIIKSSELKDLKKINKKNKNLDIEKFNLLKTELLDNEKEILKLEIKGYYDQKAKINKTPNSIISKYLNTNMLDIPKCIKDIFKYFKNNKSKYNCNCFACNNKINNFNIRLNFINNIYFDVNRKPSHIWNFNNDIGICPICKLIYFCIPAGFTSIYDKGIFINQNRDIESIIKVNQKIKIEVIENDNTNNIFRVFQTILEEMKEEINKISKYELADVQVVRYEKDRYRFNLLSKQMLKVLNKSTKELNSLIKTSYKEFDTYFNIYDETMKRLLNKENLFLLIHKLIVRKLTKPSDSHYHVGHINNLLKINNNFLEGVVGMEVKEKDILELSKNAGFYFRKAYEEKKAENKINGIAYRLLNALKTNNQHMFMDTLINCYLYIKQAVPKVFVDGMKNDYEFKSVGYAFVAGMTNEPNKTDENK
ncbi:type I-B CRISPR-associated protein Cas8b1/Cst1 [Defluviitalea phaphyphila]|uniref:type I-B CRISPR-associated protein Cas8b1/Cst1 n=1 Tax=Defluviitalea phaphyphila TaxID=1473580 RepID=UPI0007306743|nr:type I-B CRISPR-associated protein Cas8b1/Cst1 [Defluviitalea phaphyphila]